jgi:hypothetical protein
MSILSMVKTTALLLGLGYRSVERMLFHCQNSLPVLSFRIVTVTTSECKAAGIAQSVYRLAMGWTVRW